MSEVLLLKSDESQQDDLVGGKVVVEKLITCVQYPDPREKALFYSSVLLTLIMSKL